MIFYHHVPSITRYPVHIGKIDKLLDPFITDREEAKKEMEKMTDDNSDKVVERYDDKVSKRILSETPAGTYWNHEPVS